MKRFIKYGIVPAAIFLVLLAATIIVLPVVINVQKFIPEIETKLSEAAGRPVSIGPDLGLSLFPWLSVSLSDLKVGNPEGYLSDGFIKIESFEARIKLLPLFQHRIEISRFIIGGLEVNLERRKDGKANWDFNDKSNRASGRAKFAGLMSWSLPKDLSVGLFAITDGTLYWFDRTNQSRYKISDLMFLLNNVTLKEPVAMEFKAAFEGKSLAAEGKLGPLGQHPGTGALPIDLAVNMVNGISGQLKGKVFNLQNNPGYELSLHTSPFSARKLLSSLDLGSSPVTSGSDAFSSVQIDLTARGDGQSLSVEKGKIKVDDTSLDLTLAVKDFGHPDIHFSLNGDRLDLDRYLAESNTNGDHRVEPVTAVPGKQDGGTWRNMTLDGAIQLQKLAFGGGKVSDVNIKLRGADGILAVDPCSFALYGGIAKTSMTVDFQSRTPQASVEIKTKGVDAEPLLHDFAARDFLSGSLEGDIRLLFSGSSLEAIKKNLYADGSFIVQNGAIQGIDMVNAKRNVVTQTADRVLSKSDLGTPFAELRSLFTIRNGLMETHKTTIGSAAASLLVAGTADIVGGQLKLMVTPISSAAMKEGQENTAGEANGSIPFTLSGTIAEPKVHIDPHYFSEEELESPAVLEMKNLVEEKLPAPAEEDVKNLPGTTLVDPAVVAERFGLQPEVIRKNQTKKQIKVGSGRVRVSPLREEDSWR